MKLTKFKKLKFQSYKPGKYEIPNIKDTRKIIKLSDYIAEFLSNITDSVFVGQGGNIIHVLDSLGKRKDINGLETFYYTGWRGRLLAKKIQKQILKVSPGSPDRGVRQGRYFVIKNTRMPAVLVEIGFLTGRLDARRLQKSIHRQRIAYAITKGILEYLSRS